MRQSVIMQQLVIMLLGLWFKDFNTLSY